MYSERIESCGKRIAKALAIRNVRQADLAQMAKIPKSSLSLYLKDAYEPKQDRIFLIAQALHVSEAWLMGYDVPMEKEKENSPTEPVLSEGEKLMLELFRQIPADKQAAALEMLRAALKMQ
jgi:transcriptional regulator with XRE-family HTH domain